MSAAVDPLLSLVVETALSLDRLAEAAMTAGIRRDDDALVSMALDLGRARHHLERIALDAVGGGRP